MKTVLPAVIVSLCFVAAAPGVESAAPAGKQIDYTAASPIDLVARTPKGQLQSPFDDSNPDIVAQGERLFLSYSCNGCHGGGGGGICPPLTNDVWVYEGDDDTLFRLVTLGTEGLQKQGYTRKGSENVVAPMPPFGALLKNSDELWKILTFVRSRYSANADPHYKKGTPPELR